VGEAIRRRLGAGLIAWRRQEQPALTATRFCSSYLWQVGDAIQFACAATDAQDGPLPASSFTCARPRISLPPRAAAHREGLRRIDGYRVRATGPADGHAHPELQHGGFALALNGSVSLTPFTRTVIQGSRSSLSAPHRRRPRRNWLFKAWSDGGAPTHDVVANSTTSYTATFKHAEPRLGGRGTAASSLDAPTSGRVVGRPPNGGRPRCLYPLLPGPQPPPRRRSGKEVSWVCGFRWPSFLAPATALSLRFQIVSPRVMSDS
jgi:hypothetical protein